MVLSGGRLMPHDYDLGEVWTWKPAGEKPWIVRIFTKGRVWDDKGESTAGEDSGSEVHQHDSHAASSIEKQPATPSSRYSPAGRSPPFRGSHY
jgi:AGZA family xanthine/uracil permease-like MFS transporter